MKTKLFIIISFLFITASCQKGPDTKLLTTQISNKLDTHFKSGLFRIEKLDRRGSYGYSADGPKLLIYFKAELKLESDYKFNNWNKIGQSSLIAVLGSTAGGITGINPEGNKKGDIIKVYGSNNYSPKNESWIQVPHLQESKVAGAKKNKFISELDEDNDLEAKNLPAIKRYINQLQAISKDIRKHPKQLISIENKLNKVLIEAKIVADLNKSSITGIASGAQGGEYYLLANAIEKTLSKRKHSFKGYETFGSLHNIELVASKKIKFGIAQGDLLKQRSNKKIKALMALFPEVIQIITLKSSNLKHVKDLIGKKVNLGPLGSGTRSNALNVFKAHSISLSDINSSDYGLKQSLKLLQEKEIDAIFFTGGYPTSAILNFSKKYPIHLLSQNEKALGLLQKAPANLKLAIPKNVYFGQDEAYPTTGTTAILFSHESATKEEIQTLLKNIFLHQSTMTQTSSKAASFSKGNWNKGIEVEIHPEAQAFFK